MPPCDAPGDNLSTDGKWRSFPKVPNLLQCIVARTYYARRKVKGKPVPAACQTPWPAARTRRQRGRRLEFYEIIRKKTCVKHLNGVDAWVVLPIRSAFDNASEQSQVLDMKTLLNSLAWLAAGVVLTGAAQAQDKGVLFHQGTGTDASARITLEMNTEPQMTLDSGTQVSGLFVDLMRPQQTWAMLDPSAPAENLSGPAPRLLPPLTAPRQFNDDPTVHDLNFALLRFSFH
jgi:hypothetical protein